MIISTGLDLASVPRIRRFIDRHGRRGLNRLFTPQEIEYCLAQAHSGHSFAVRFAAKEAFYKAAGTGVGPAGGWRDVEVLRLASGRPILRLHGRAAVFAWRLGVQRIHLSLSHTDDFAAATVVLEG